MKTSNLTVGSVLPSELSQNCSEELLNLSLETARNIEVLGLPIPSNLTSEDVIMLNSIFNTFVSGSLKNTESAYWNKEETSSDSAYWSKD